MTLGTVSLVLPRASVFYAGIENIPNSPALIGNFEAIALRAIEKNDFLMKCLFYSIM
jgi:hypothetical protein